MAVTSAIPAISLITQLALERKKQAAEKKKKAEKLEELVSALYEHNVWVLRHAVSNQTNSNDKYEQIPFTKLSAIQKVYFPEFEAHFSNLDVATARWIWPKIAGLTVEPSDEAANLYNKCFNEVVHEIQAYAKRERVIVESW